MKSLAKRIYIPALWATVVVSGLWALMHFSSPASNLEPYDKFKKAALTAKQDAENADPVDLAQIAAERERKAPQVTQISSPQDAPGSHLPRETLEHISAGMTLAEAGKFNQADQEFEQAAKSSPDSPEVFAIWGTSLRMNKRYQGANKKFARALELAPEDAEIAFNWGISLMEEGNSDEAIRLFKKTTELNPNNHLAYNYLGKSYGQKKMYAEEEQAHRNVIRIAPDFGWGHFNLAIVLSLQKKFEDAVPHFQRAIAIDQKEFEKPFVVQFLAAMGQKQSAAPKTEDVTTSMKTAKAEVPSPVEEKKTEGSDDHKMEEGSKASKPTTSVRGKFLVNGVVPGPDSVIIMETKDKLRIPDQKVITLTIEQGGLQFIPQHSVVPIGSTIVFANKDLEVHNIYSKSNGNQFNLGAMAAGSSKELKFTQAGPVVLRCNLHKDMIGTVFVAPNGYFTKPDAEGNYSFHEIASKDYILQAWAPYVAPSDIGDNLKSADLKGVDQTINIDLKTSGKPGQVHDMVDPTNYNAIVDNIERETFQAIQDWKDGKKFISRKRMLMAITKHYEGEGLKGALEKSFSQKRSQGLEDKLDDIRKKISGIKTDGEEITESGLKSQAQQAVVQLRNNVKELEARLNPDSSAVKQ